MATTSYLAFLPEVIPYVHDCPQIAAVSAIRSAAIEFCERSSYWQVSLAPIDAVISTGEYTPVVPAGARIADLLHVWYNTILLVPKSNEELTKLYRGIDWRTLVGQPSFYCSDLSGVVRVVPAPSVSYTGAIVVRASLAPTRASVDIETNIYEKQAEVIAMGARARLLGMSGQPAYDPMQAQAQRSAFLAGCNNARIRANKAASRSSVAIEIPRYV